MGGRLSSFFFRRREIRALILGLDAAGKTTLLYRMKLGEIVTTIPTIGFNVETIRHKSLTLTAWDVGGRDKMRPLLRHYLAGTQVLVYMVDSGDRERLGQAREELHWVTQEEELREAVLLVLANKQDIEGCLSLHDVSQGLDFPALSRHCPAAAIFPVSAREGVGVAAAWDWVEERVRAAQFQQSPLSRASCGALHKAWSVRALLKSTLSSAKSLLYTKTDLQHTGKDLQHTGKDLQHTGNDLLHTGNDLQHTGKDLQHTGKDLQHTGIDLQHTDT